MPSITVIVPTRQRNHLLPRCLASLEAQTLKDFEVVLVDDNPPQSRVAQDSRLAAWLERPWIRLVIHDEPRNAARARNYGLNYARGEWVTYLDDDDAYHVQKLEKQFAHAARSGLPLGLCGLVYNLPGRRRAKQITETEFVGEQLLLAAIADTKLIFHRQSPVRFDEDLDAGEDAHFFLGQAEHFGVERVFNVPEPLVEVFLQTGARVNLNAEGQRRAADAIQRRFAARFGVRAAELYRLRSRLGYCKIASGNSAEMVRLAAQLVRNHGISELRFVLNSLLFKLPFMRRFLVS